MVKWERGKIGTIQIKGTLRKQMEIVRRMRRRYSIMVMMNNVVLGNRRKGRFLIVQIIILRRTMQTD